MDNNEKDLDRYVCDFETVNHINDCRVWAWGCYNIYNSTYKYGKDIEEFMDFILSDSRIVYFHNLKFDGEFILNWLLDNDFQYTSFSTMNDMEFNTIISDMKIFYSIKIRCGKNIVTIYDSNKIITFPVSDIPKKFNFDVCKGDIDYNKFRPVGYEMDENEKSYLYRDCEIVARALRIFLDNGLDSMTMASNAMMFYKNLIGRKTFERRFPPVKYFSDIRYSYKGGFTYLNPKFAGKDVGEGIVLDVNSLYPWVMHEKPLPYGEGIYFDGEYIYDEYYPLYIIEFKCEFKLKDGYIPTIQLKNNLSFVPNEYISDSNGEVVLCLTNVDYELFLEHYDVDIVEFIGGYKFRDSTNLFKNYVDYWMNVKITADKEGNKGMRTLAKLMMNSLYGKFGTNPFRRSVYPSKKKGDKIEYVDMDITITRGYYLPVASFITAYAREKTIRTAQMCYDRFIYSDTDSLHLLGLSLPSGIDIDDYKLGAWAHESSFTKARFLRQKCYIEEIDGKTKVTCAGLPSKLHHLVTFDNFVPGAIYHGKLLPVRTDGGVVLHETDFTIKI